MPRYRLTIEYDGTAFCGWQAQKNGRGIQDALAQALEAYCGARAVIYGAGRTDSGVHALAQSAHFDLEAEKDPHQLRAAMNFYLRDQKIVIIHAEKTSMDFHARFSVKERHYVYLILNRAAPPALMANRAWHIPQDLDEGLMNEAAQLLTGTHDFTTFRAAACQAASPVKTLDALDVVRSETIIAIHARARSFLHHQVRSLAGALVFAGLGRMIPDQVFQILEARERAQCPPLAPACGLYLAKIDYPPPHAIEVKTMPDLFLGQSFHA